MSETPDTENTKPGLFTRLANFLRGKAQPTAAPVAAPEPQVTEPPKLLPFYVKIRHPKAGLVKIFIKAESPAKAKDEALVDYVSKLSTTVDVFK